MDDQENIERFFDKETSEKQRFELKQKIEKGQGGDANIILEVAESLKEREELSNLRGQLKKIANEEDKSSKQIFLPFLKVAASLAIFAVMTTLIWKYTTSSNNEEVFNEYFLAYDGYKLSRDAESSMFNEGLILYDKGSYEKALEIFISSGQIYDEPRISLLISSCYLMLDEPSKSQKILDNNQEYSDSLLEGNRRWYLALTYLKLDQLHDSRKILEEIVEDNGPFKSQAEALLKESIYR